MGGGTWSVDRAIVEYTRFIPGLATGVSSTVPRFTRSVFRRFIPPAIFSQAPGIIIEDSRFEEPTASGFGMIQPVVGPGSIVEIRRSVLNGGGVNVPGIVFQGGSATTTRVHVDSVTVDFVGLRGIGFTSAATPPAVIMLRAINLTRIGNQAINWPSAGPVLQATGLWFGSATTPPSAASSSDPTPGSVWNSAFVNLLPVSPVPHAIQLLPRGLQSQAINHLTTSPPRDTSTRQTDSQSPHQTRPPARRTLPPAAPPR